MKISLNWINDYVEIKDENAKLLADKITNSGINVEHITTLNIPNLVIGKVISCTPHPDSDHLHVCKVDINDSVLDIVCGAANVREGIKVIVAKVGAILPGNFEIKKAKVRGIESNGMICALFELGLEEKTEENYAKGIYELDVNAPIGGDPIKYLNLDDTIYELDLNPNRNDCLSHLGFAYQVASVINKKITMPETKHNEISTSINDLLKLKVSTNNCYLYLNKMVKDVVIKDSPDFIKKRLTNAGMRPINNVVDISNYIMLEYGQPLHFFDYDKLNGTLDIRMAHDGETLITLDNEKRLLKDSDVIITDGNTPVAVAGVMGGLDSGIDEKTKNIVIESAIFNPLNIRYTSIRMNLRSEASLRFEKPLNYEYTYLAIERACYLLEKYADAKVLSDTLIYDTVNKNDKVVSLSIEKINDVLGVKLTKKDIDEALSKLAFNFTFLDNTYTVTIPNRRMDVNILEDIIEEIGSLYGYDKIVAHLPKIGVKPGKYSKEFIFRKDVCNRLINLGLNETRTYTLISEEESKRFNNHFKDSLNVLLPMNQDKKVIRQSLLPSLINVYNYNKSHFVDEIKIFEVANAYNNDNYEEVTLVSGLLSGTYLINEWKNINEKVDFYTVKGIIENLLLYLGFNNRYSFKENNLPKEIHPFISASIYIDNIEVGYLGKLHPSFIKDDVYVFEMSLTKIFNIKPSKIKYKEPSKYPEIKKDFAFIVDKNINSSDIIKTIKKVSNKTLNNVMVFDLYEGDKISPNKKSIAFNLTFGLLDRTLTQEEVDIEFKKIINEVEITYQAVLRNN